MWRAWPKCRFGADHPKSSPFLFFPSFIIFNSGRRALIEGVTGARRPSTSMLLLLVPFNSAAQQQRPRSSRRHRMVGGTLTIGSVAAKDEGRAPNYRSTAASPSSSSSSSSRQSARHSDLLFFLAQAGRRLDKRRALVVAVVQILLERTVSPPPSSSVRNGGGGTGWLRLLLLAGTRRRPGRLRRMGAGILVHRHRHLQGRKTRFGIVGQWALVSVCPLRRRRRFVVLGETTKLSALFCSATFSASIASSSAWLDCCCWK